MWSGNSEQSRSCSPHGNALSQGTSQARHSPKCYISANPSHLTAKPAETVAFRSAVSAEPAPENDLMLAHDEIITFRGPKICSSKFTGASARPENPHIIHASINGTRIKLDILAPHLLTAPIRTTTPRGPQLPGIQIWQEHSIIDRA